MNNATRAIRESLTTGKHSERHCAAYNNMHDVIFLFSLFT